MGMGGVSAGELLIVLVIIAMIFGTGRLRTIGSDLGHAIRSFRQSIQSPGRTGAESDRTASAIDRPKEH